MTLNTKHHLLGCLFAAAILVLAGYVCVQFVGGWKLLSGQDFRGWIIWASPAFFLSFISYFPCRRFLANRIGLKYSPGNGLKNRNRVDIFEGEGIVKSGNVAAPTC